MGISGGRSWPGSPSPQSPTRSSPLVVATGESDVAQRADRPFREPDPKASYRYEFGPSREEAPPPQALTCAHRIGNPRRFPWFSAPVLRKGDAPAAPSVGVQRKFVVTRNRCRRALGGDKLSAVSLASRWPLPLRRCRPPNVMDPTGQVLMPKLRSDRANRPVTSRCRATPARSIRRPDSR